MRKLPMAHPLIGRHHLIVKRELTKGTWEEFSLVDINEEVFVGSVVDLNVLGISGPI